MADTSSCLWHTGSYPYGWEDAGTATKRYASFEFPFDTEGNNSAWSSIIDLPFRELIWAEWQSISMDKWFAILQRTSCLHDTLI